MVLFCDGGPLRCGPELCNKTISNPNTLSSDVTRCQTGSSIAPPRLPSLKSSAQYYFRFQIEKTNVYQQIEFRRDNSTHGWDITTSGLEKQTSEFFSWFRFRLFNHNRHVILHQPVTMHRNRGRLMTSNPLSRWQPRWHNTTSGFRLCDVIVFKESKSICKPTFDDISQSTVEI